MTLLGKIWKCPDPDCGDTLAVKDWGYENLAPLGAGSPVCGCGEDFELVDDDSPEAKYLRVVGVKCPFCGSEDLDPGSPKSAVNGGFNVAVDCSGCGGGWTDHNRFY